MSLVEIEAELEQLGPDDLRHLALKSWMIFVEKERRQSGVNECDEDDPRLLAALDEAIAKADAAPGQGHTGARGSRPLERMDYRVIGVLPGAS